mgnify:CR=1 FL=1
MVARREREPRSPRASAGGAGAEGASSHDDDVRFWRERALRLAGVDAPGDERRVRVGVARQAAALHLVVDGERAPQRVLRHGLARRRAPAGLVPGPREVLRAQAEREHHLAAF